MPFPKNLAKAKQLAVYWDNYIAYLSTLDDKQPNIGNGTPKPPQTSLYIQPFALPLSATQFVKANVTSDRWTSFGSEFTGYSKATLNTGGGETEFDISNIRIARVVTYTNLEISPYYLGEIEEFIALNRRTEAMDKAIREGKEFDVVLDMLEEDGQDAAQFVEQVGEQIEIIIANQIVPEDLEVWRQKYDG